MTFAAFIRHSLICLVTSLLLLFLGAGIACASGYYPDLSYMEIVRELHAQAFVLLLVSIVMPTIARSEQTHT